MKTNSKQIVWYYIIDKQLDFLNHQVMSLQGVRQFLMVDYSNKQINFAIRQQMPLKGINGKPYLIQKSINLENITQ